MNPLITCLCLTRDRPQWLPKAILSFIGQTYPNKELLIVNSGSQISVEMDESILYRKIEAWRHPRPTVGALRNAGCEEARGEFIANWDDDDWSEPERLETQLRLLQATGKAVAGYHSMKFSDGSNWWQYKGTPNFALGTSLFFRKEWWHLHHFSDMMIGQDEQFSMKAASEKTLISEPDRDLMWASVHSKNTSPRPVNNVNCWTPLPGFRWKAAA